MGFKTTAHHSTALSFLKIHMHEAPPTGTIAVQLDDLVGALTKIDFYRNWRTRAASGLYQPFTFMVLHPPIPDARRPARTIPAHFAS
jgi:hypothetical protein